MTRPARAFAAMAALLSAACARRNDRLQVSGAVEIRELQLAPLAAGRLSRLLKDEGESVHQGDTIAVLEQPGLDALIAQRRAQAHAAGLLDGNAGAFPGGVVEVSSRAEFTPRAALTERERADVVFGIKVELDGGDAGGRVKAGMPATVEIPVLP